MSRKKKLLLNTITGMLKQIVAVICGFILPRFMLMYYGSETNGLISSIAHFLSFISLLDMGVGAVIQANLYKPLADKNDYEVSKIILASKRFFRKLAYIFLVYILILLFIFPNIAGNNYEPIFTISLLLIIAFSTFAQYFFGMTYELLLNADQKSYIQLILQIATLIINTALAVLLMKCGASVHVVKLASSLVFVLRPIGQAIYVKRNYSLQRKIKLVGEPIKQKWNGFSQHLASVVCQNIDVVVLTTFSSLANVSIYAVYYLVTNGVEQIIMTAATGLEAMFGNMIANKETSKLLKTFEAVEWIVHNTVTLLFTITALTIVPFISVYTRGITDANYNVPVFGTLLVVAYAFECLRIPYFRIIKAAGHFKETQNGAFISAGLNIVITVILVFKYGLIGAAIGTLVAMLYHTCYFVWYLKSHIINRSIKFYVKFLAMDIIVFSIAKFLNSYIIWSGESYLDWVLFAAKNGCLVFIIVLIINIIFNRKLIKLSINMLYKKKL